MRAVTGSLANNARVLLQIAPESSPERSANSLSHSFFVVPSLSPTIVEQICSRPFCCLVARKADILEEATNALNRKFIPGIPWNSASFAPLGSPCILVWDLFWASRTYPVSAGAFNEALSNLWPQKTKIPKIWISVSGRLGSFSGGGKNSNTVKTQKPHTSGVCLQEDKNSRTKLDNNSNFRNLRPWDFGRLNDGIRRGHSRFVKHCLETEFSAFLEILTLSKRVSTVGWEEGGRSRFLGRGCNEALFSERKGFSVKRGEAIQWMRGLVRISTGKAIQWRAPGHSVNRRTLKTEKLLSSSPSQKSALRGRGRISCIGLECIKVDTRCSGHRDLLVVAQHWWLVPWCVTWVKKHKPQRCLLPKPSWHGLQQLASFKVSY